MEILNSKKKEKLKTTKKYWMRKHERPKLIIDKIKLWPSKSGVLHGIRSVKVKGSGYVELTTHCEQIIKSKNSKNCRAARWLRNKWYVRACPKCHIPGWKLEKFSGTRFV